ncbi:MAG TPA: type II toxin-antitoxin system HicB family antitoxin, partial [Thermomicrobiales bacterium]|nr:type II toxin-antitoxin system HicB family antitoxin [Thermomicrobiales bacterium]
WDGADRLWVADVRDVRVCSAHGETAEEALWNVTEALADIHADVAERGIALPQPTERPVLAQAS